ncbi:SIS domain-containing protein [bacterium]|nr:SIS domain-containing protein [bacterium]
MRTASSYAKAYVGELKAVLDRLPWDDLDRVVRAIASAHRRGRQIFIIGNGGSAATASHMMNDLAKGTLGHKGNAPWKRFRAIALTDNLSLLTAWANDADNRRVFSEPLRNLAGRGDLLVAISASGNSPNIVAAVRAARRLGVKVVGLAGFGGGQLARLADVALVVPSDEYGPVEDAHLVLDHIVTGYLFEKLRAAHRRRRR